MPQMKFMLFKLVISGGTTSLPGFSRRLQREITSLVPQNANVGARICPKVVRFYAKMNLCWENIFVLW